MKTILKDIHTTIIQFLEENKKQFNNAVHIINNGFGNIQNLEKKRFSKTFQGAILVSYPMPTKMLESISGPCWEQIVCEIQIQTNIKAPIDILETAEKLIYLLSHHRFEKEYWDGSFVLDTQRKWELSQGNTPTLTFQFISNLLNLRNL